MRVAAKHQAKTLFPIGELTKPQTRELAEKYGVEPVRAASLLDTTSCCIQGVIPYGAQILIAAALSASIGVSSFAILKGLFYPALMLLGLAFSISRTKEAQV